MYKNKKYNKMRTIVRIVFYTIVKGILEDVYDDFQ